MCQVKDNGAYRKRFGQLAGSLCLSVSLFPSLCLCLCLCLGLGLSVVFALLFRVSFPFLFLLLFSFSLCGASCHSASVEATPGDELSCIHCLQHPSHHHPHCHHRHHSPHQSPHHHPRRFRSCHQHRHPSHHFHMCHPDQPLRHATHLPHIIIQHVRNTTCLGATQCLACLLHITRLLYYIRTFASILPPRFPGARIAFLFIACLACLVYCVHVYKLYTQMVMECHANMSNV